MCRIEERIYIRPDGRRQVFEDRFPCDKSRRGKLCSKVKRRTTEYFPKQLPVVLRDNESSLLSSNYLPTPPAGTGSYLIEEQRLSAIEAQPLTQDSEIVIESGSSKKNGKNKEDPLITLSSNEEAIESSDSEASYTIRTGFGDVAVPLTDHLAQSQRYQTRHDVPQSHHRYASSSSSTSEPESPINSSIRLPIYPPTIVHSLPHGVAPPSPNASRAAAPPSPSYRTKTASPKKPSRDNISMDGRMPLDYSWFVGYSASTHAGSSRTAAPEITDRTDDREKHRNERKFAESEKRRAEEGEARRRKKEKEERPPTKKPGREKTRPPVGRHTKRHTRQTYMTRADIDELDRLRLQEEAQMARERKATEQREREERAAALRQQQQMNGYRDLPGGDWDALWNTSTNTRLGDSVSGHRPSISGNAPPASLTPITTWFAPQQQSSTRPPSSHSTYPNAQGHESYPVGLDLSADPAPTRETDGETAQANSQEDKTRQGVVVMDDTCSEISSNGLGSVFSVASRTSLTSAATDLSRDTGYSAAHIESATANLLSMLEVDEVLAPLYVAAIRDSFIGPRRFENNFRRLLKLYAGRLKEEARDSLEHLAARLVLSKARLLAIAIVEKYGNQASPQDVGKDPVIKDTVCQPEDISEAEEEDVTSYESVLEDLAKVRDFWSGSGAFLTLRTELRRFVENAKKYTAQAQPAVMDQPDMTQKTPTSECTQQFIAALFKLYHFPLRLWAPKSPCPPGMEQIEWQCKCGVRGFGKVQETRTGGVAKLKAHMERATGTTFRSHKNSYGVSQSVLNFQGIWQRPRGVIRSIFHSDPTLPTSNRPNQPQTTSISIPNTINIQGRTLILMSCLHRGETAKDLYQDDIVMLRNDRNLMYFLNERYRARRGKFRSRISLRKVIGIHFTQFLLSVSKNVEVRYHAKCCTSQTCECLPPSDLVDPTGTDPQYQYAPVPPATSPPYLPDYLLHLFDSPSCIDEAEQEVFQRLPKRTKGELAGTRSQRAKGWGIYYEEGWDQLKIAWLVFLVIFMGSFLFGVLWAALKKDVQGAFGISAWWVTIGGSTLALFAIGSSRV